MPVQWGDVAGRAAVVVGLGQAAGTMRARRTVQGMADNSKPAIVLRTTSDGAGQPLGVVTGTGSSPERALADLSDRALAMATEASAAELVDVRLVAGNPETAAWCAIGTLCQLPARSHRDEPGR